MVVVCGKLVDLDEVGLGNEGSVDEDSVGKVMEDVVEVVAIGEGRWDGRLGRKLENGMW
jgi:hypothetical protein